MLDILVEVFGAIKSAYDGVQENKKLVKRLMHKADEVLDELRDLDLAQFGDDSDVYVKLMTAYTSAQELAEKMSNKGWLKKFRKMAKSAVYKEKFREAEQVYGVFL